MLDSAYADRLFIDTLQDIESRMESDDPYQVLGISGLIRKLLMDDYPLVDQVNRERKVKLRFRIGLPIQYPPGIPEPNFYSIQDAFDPKQGPAPVKSSLVSRDGFLSATVLRVDGEIWTLKDFVQYEANVMGGVHAGTPKKDKHKALDEIDRFFQVGGYRASLRQLKTIASVMLDGLSDLKEAVRKDS